MTQRQLWKKKRGREFSGTRVENKEVMSPKYKHHFFTASILTPYEGFEYLSQNCHIHNPLIDSSFKHLFIQTSVHQQIATCLLCATCVRVRVSVCVRAVGRQLLPNNHANKYETEVVISIKNRCMTPEI